MHGQRTRNTPKTGHNGPTTSMRTKPYMHTMKPHARYMRICSAPHDNRHALQLYACAQARDKRLISTAMLSRSRGCGLCVRVRVRVRVHVSCAGNYPDRTWGLGHPIAQATNNWCAAMCVSCVLCVPDEPCRQVGSARSSWIYVVSISRVSCWVIDSEFYA